MDVAGRPSPNLVEVLRSTLENLEKSSEVRPDDPALQEFKRSIVRLMADLQLSKERKSKPDDRLETTSGSVVTLIVKPSRKHPPSLK